MIEGKFQLLPKNIQTAIELRASGDSLDTIVTKTKIGKRTLSRMFGPKGSHLNELKDYQKLIATQIEKREISIQTEMQDKAIWAFQELCDLASKAHERVKLEALNSILDRAGYSRINKSESKQEILKYTKEDRKHLYADVIELVEGKKAV